VTASADFGSDITATPRALVPVVAGPDVARPRLIHGPVTAVERVGDRYWVLRVAAPHIARTSLPGQFVMISIAAPDEPVIILPRPIAVYGVERDAGTIDLCIGVVGAGTRRLASLTPGVVTTVVGPLGRSFPLGHVTQHLLLVGRGIGVCSLTELSRAATERQIRVTAVVSGRHGGALVGVDRLGRHGAHVMTVTDADGTSDPDQLRASLLARGAISPPDMIATCGSDRLLELCSDLASGWDTTLYTSVEEHMACGLGYCHGCARPVSGTDHEGSLVCTDGPVFQVDRRSAVSAW
jgi:dihydroorotate dehydrogenase electron transfer subunit